jgi:glucans biosynthesis protein C
MSAQPTGFEDKTQSKHQESHTLSSQEKHERLSYLDWLRVLAVLGVFYAHALSIFNIFYWHISDERLGSLIVFGTEWGMALFFLLTGASAWFSLGKRSSRVFLTERFARLVIPFLAGVLLLSPPQGFFLDTSRSLYHGSFLAYYPHFFQHISLSLTPEVLAAYGFNLWFLAVLFLMRRVFGMRVKEEI